LLSLIEEANMSELKPLKILLAVDGSPHSRAAVKLAMTIPWPAATTMHVLAVAPERCAPPGLSPQARQVVDETLGTMRRVERAAAERLAARTAEDLLLRGWCAEPETRTGRPSEAILGRAAELGADLILIGARGLSAPDEFQLGATAYKLARCATCSVLIARPPKHPQPVSIVMATDASPEAHRAADFLRRLALPRWAQVTVISVAEAMVALPTGEREVLDYVPAIVRQALLEASQTCADQSVQRLQGCQARVRSSIRHGHPAVEILAAAREHDADLVVIGARGHKRAEPFPLGSVAQKVVKYAMCSVLLVR
jgi:nucleotide-binding universal stress UspA family protein